MGNDWLWSICTDILLISEVVRQSDDLVVSTKPVTGSDRSVWLFSIEHQKEVNMN